jgi:catechol 2,3-dioxygenase-like lactoylglutathione lyase family enzyme
MSTVVDRAAPPAGTTSFFQVGYVVPDLAAAIGFFTETLGAPPFFVIEDVELSDLYFRGKPFAPRESIAFAYLGHLQFELVQPLAGGDPSTYTEFLDRNPGGGVHHVATHVATIEQGLADLGLDESAIVQTGRFGEATRFAYLDIATPTGAMLEIVQLDEPALQMFEALRRGELRA